MVEGLNASMLAHARRMDSLMFPGLVLLFLGVLIQSIAYSVGVYLGWSGMSSLNFFDGICSVAMFAGLTLIAYGITYSRRGNIVLPLAFCIVMLCSADLISWMYFVRLNWTPAPSTVYIIPFVPPGYLPLILTLLFLLLILLARFNYSVDPRKSGLPRYIK